MRTFTKQKVRTKTEWMSCEMYNFDEIIEWRGCGCYKWEW